MTEQITLTVRMFGAFKKYRQGNLTMTMPFGSSISEVKSKLVNELQKSHPVDADLVNKSVIADSTKVLRESEIVLEDSILAILPPVCGG